MQEGWLCPRCKKVNAPWVPHCDCKSEDKESSQKINESKWGYHCPTCKQWCQNGQMHICYYSSPSGTEIWCSSQDSCAGTKIKVQ